MATSILSRHLRRIPDGETGERTNWIGFQFGVFISNPLIEQLAPDPEVYAPLPQVRLREDADPAQLHFDRLGYADAALASYGEFRRLRDQGAIARRTRFQVSLPTPLAPVTAFVTPESRAAVEPAYEAAMRRELDQITSEIPLEDLAIQWDVAVEFGILEGVWPCHFTDILEGISERLVRIGDWVPEPVELGYHLCYGDYDHHHFADPQDAAKLVEVANRSSAGVERSIQWLHLPVPRDRTDEAYYAPLRDLALRDGTELYLGLVHFSDGLEGAKRRIEAAQQVVECFGVATECGMGRRAVEQIPDLLRIHSQVAAPHGAGRS
jgi:hypothetical protein